ncbi:DNA polymerase III alpha subunit [Cutibacterium acnes JCM 18909]|nr:DNA polymerase III alpha subunit [Cutibacterium acnes JCM 18909]
MGAVRNVGANAVAEIIRAREENGPASDFFHFPRSVSLTVCNKRLIESLIKAGAFDSMGHSRRGLMAVYGQAVDAVIDIKRNQANGQDDLFGMGDDSLPTQMGVERVVPDDDWDRSTKLAFEREMLGLYVSDHPLRGLEAALEAESDISVAELVNPEGHHEAGTPWSAWSPRSCGVRLRTVTFGPQRPWRTLMRPSPSPVSQRFISEWNPC